MPIIKSLKAREILDSRGNPTVEVCLETSRGKVKASVPSGASKGKYEAVEIRDGGKRYDGMGVSKAIGNINKIISPRLKAKGVSRQNEVDRFLIELDGTENKSKLGVNALLGVSIAVCKAESLEKGIPLYEHINQIYGESGISLPRPCFNIINGGAHAGNNLDFQEFMVVPRKKKTKDAIRKGSEFYHSLREKIKKKYASSAINVGDEGGFAPPLSDPEDAIKLIFETEKMDLILDVAAGEFFSEGSYRIGINSFSKEELAGYYLQMVRKYSILGLEDPFYEDDIEGWQKLMSDLEKQKSEVMVIGDDLLATNISRMKKAEKMKACNAMILKPNQIGTLSESIEAAKLARQFGWKIIASHRSGETNDDFISDFAVGIGADFIKSGAPARGERVAKYNRLMEIEDEFATG